MTDALILPLVGTLAPMVREYLRGRVARGEITRPTSVDLSYTLAGLVESFGRRPLSQLGPKAIDRWLESIGHHAPATRREYLSRVRGFCHWMVAQGHIVDNPTDHVPTIRQPRQVPRTLTTNEVAMLLHACPDARARAVVWLMVGCGLRCVEVSRLDVQDYDADGRTISVTGKAGHERRLPVPCEVAAAVDAYLDEAGRPAGALIRARGTADRLSPRTLSGYVRGWMVAAGVKTSPLDGRSAHALRRTAGSDVMDACGDIRVVQEMLGHVRIETTAMSYLRPVAMGKLRVAMEGRGYGAA
jgi:integrase/recombinase XerC